LASTIGYRFSQNQLARDIFRYGSRIAKFLFASFDKISNIISFFRYSGQTIGAIHARPISNEFGLYGYCGSLLQDSKYDKSIGSATYDMLGGNGMIHQ
jgi:hypothetical protein